MLAFFAHLGGKQRLLWLHKLHDCREARRMVAHSIQACMLDTYLPQYDILDCCPDLQALKGCIRLLPLALPTLTAPACVPDCTAKAHLVPCVGVPVGKCHLQEEVHLQAQAQPSHELCTVRSAPLT